MKRFSAIAIIIICQGIVNQLYGQWKNEIFRNPQMEKSDSNALDIEQYNYQLQRPNKRLKDNKPYAQLGALHYSKNNEYFQATNPGETIIGQRIWTVVDYRNSNEKVKAIYSLGAVLEYPFENRFSQKIQLKPIVRVTLKTDHSTLVVGNIDGHINHNLPEPVFNYEWALKSAVEYGSSWNKHGKRLQIHQWLNWRQQAILDASQQEIIVGGFSANWILLHKPQHALSVEVPTFMIHQHQGGENFRIQKPIQNKNNSGIGLRIKTNVFQAEYYGIQCIDFSPQSLQPYKNGFGHLLNVGYQIKKNHRLVSSYWSAKEFHAPLGAAIYGCVNLSNPYKNIAEKELLMLRYAYMKRWINNTVSEFRFEPTLDLKTNEFLLSFALYFRFYIGDYTSYTP